MTTTDDGHLSLIAPTICAVLAGLLVAWRLYDGTPRMLAWGGVAGAAGGAFATESISPTELALGSLGATLVASAGATLGAAAALAAVRHSSGRWAPPQPDVTLQAGSARGRVGVLLAVTCGVSLGLVAAGLPGWGAVVVIAVAAAILARQGWPPVMAFAVCAAVASAGIVVFGEFVLSPAGAVGGPWPSVAVVLMLAAPLFVLESVRPGSWSAAYSRAGAFDVGAVLGGIVAGFTWVEPFRHLDDDQTVAKLTYLGQDNLAHIMMLKATRESGTALGSSEVSRGINPAYADYFPGASVWQASIGDLFHLGSDVEAYVFSTAILVGLVVTLLISFGSATAPRSFGPASCAVAVVIGAVTTRLALALFDPGFPGQLLVGYLLLAALAAIVAERGRNASSWLPLALMLALCSIAIWRTWSLAAPFGMLALLGVMADRPWVRGQVRARKRVVLASVAGAACLVGAAIALEHDLIAEKLDEISIEGALFTGIPFSFAFATLLFLPAFAGSSGEPLAARFLLVGTAAATLGLSSWHLYRVGHVGYYTYKLQAFVVILGAAALIAFAALLAVRLDATFGPVATGLGLVSVVLAALPVYCWPKDSYRDHLVAVSLNAPRERMVCAARLAHDFPGKILLAEGFGNDADDLFTTRVMDVSTGNNSSGVFWLPIVAGDPQAYPWAAATLPIVLVEGPSITRSARLEVLRAAEQNGVTLERGPTECRELGNSRLNGRGS